MSSFMLFVPILSVISTVREDCALPGPVRLCYHSYHRDLRRIGQWRNTILLRIGCRYSQSLIHLVVSLLLPEPGRQYTARIVTIWRFHEFCMGHKLISAHLKWRLPTWCLSQKRCISSIALQFSSPYSAIRDPQRHHIWTKSSLSSNFGNPLQLRNGP